MSYTKRVRYTDSTTGRQVMTGLCRDLQDALLKAAMLNGVVVDEDDGVVWSNEQAKQNAKRVGVDHALRKL